MTAALANLSGARERLDAAGLVSAILRARPSGKDLVQLRGMAAGNAQRNPDVVLTFNLAGRHMAVKALDVIEAVNRVLGMGIDDLARAVQGPSLNT